jgi:hypothetical protein
MATRSDPPPEQPKEQHDHGSDLSRGESTYAQPTIKNFRDWDSKYQLRYAHMFGQYRYAPRFDFRNDLRKGLEGEVHYFAATADNSPVPITEESGASGDYFSTVISDGAVGYWRLGELDSNLTVATGTYSGNGSTQAISPGFTPKVFITKADHATNGVAMIRTDTMSTGARDVTNGATNAGINALSGASVTVEHLAVSTGRTNESGKTYYWYALGGINCVTSSYTGDGTSSRALTGAGGTPVMAWIIRVGGTKVVVRTTSMGTEDYDFGTDNGDTDRILSLDSDGITIAADTDVNQSTIVYHVVYFLASTNLHVGSYVGNNTDDRDLPASAMAFDPTLVHIKGNSGANAQFKTAQLTGDAALTYTSAAKVTNIIQSLIAVTGKFQVGTSAQANFTGITYYFWAFTTAATGLFEDSAGSNNDAATKVGILTQGVAGALSGDTNKAITLDGSTGRALIAFVSSTGECDVEDVFTLEAWIKKAANGTSMGILSDQDSGYYMRMNSDNTLGLNKQGISDIVKSTTTITDTNWHHVVATKSGATVALYIDGVDVTGTVTNATIATLTTTALIGARHIATPDEFFNGSIDEVALYPTALSAAKVLFHYQLGVGTVTSGTRVRLTFDTCDYFEYNTSSDYFSWAIGCDEVLRLDTTGLSYLANDDSFSLTLVSSNPRWTVASTDYLEYNRASDYFSFVVAGTERARISSGGIVRDSLLTTTGDIYYASAASTPARLGIGANGTLLQMVAGLPAWVAAASAVAHTILSATHTDSLAASVVDGDTIIGNVTPAWSRLAISIPAANVRNVLGIDNGEVRPSWKTALDSTAPSTSAVGDAASSGTSLVFSHRDHIHGREAFATNTVALSTAAAAGAATTLIRSDATIAAFDATVPTTIAIADVAATGVINFAARRDHLHGSPSTWTATAHNLLSAIHGDTTTAAAAVGALITGLAGPVWARLLIGASGTLLRSDGTSPAWTTLYSRHTYVNVPDAAQGVTISAGDAQGAILHSGPAAETADALEVDAEAAPGANGLPVTWQYGDTNDLDTAAVWTEIATVTLSSEKSTRTTSMTNATIPANVLIRVNWGTIVGTPSDATTTLHVKRPLAV